MEGVLGLCFFSSLMSGVGKKDGTPCIIKISCKCGIKFSDWPFAGNWQGDTWTRTHRRTLRLTDSTGKKGEVTGDR